MLTLYFKPTCVFSRRVMAVIDRLKLEVDLKDASDSDIESELVSKGGKSIVPFLIDSELEFESYESDDIVSHLQINYSKISAPVRPRIQIGDNVCISCEG